MSALATVLFTWDGETATVNLVALALVAFIASMAWRLRR
jgi:hypothetical protein